MEQDTRTAKELIAAAGESVRGHSYGLDTLLVIAEEEGWSADRAQRLLAGCESLRDSRARISELERERDEARELLKRVLDKARARLAERMAEALIHMHDIESYDRAYVEPLVREWDALNAEKGGADDPAHE